jgi:hypothetical protein
LKQFRIEFIGGTYRKVAELSPALRRVVTEVPSVDYLTSLQLMQTADILLVIDAPAELTVFLPSKLVDYVGTGKHIVGITPPGTSADLISRLGGKCVSPEDPEKIAAMLEEVVTEFGSGRPPAREAFATVREEFSVANIASRMSDLLASVVT